jgi:hypothetical protein
VCPFVNTYTLVIVSYSYNTVLYVYYSLLFVIRIKQCCLILIDSYLRLLGIIIINRCPLKEKRITTLIYKSMILTMRLSLRKKNFLSTRTTHKEELEYLGITLGELIKFGAQEIEKFFRRGKNSPKVDI